MQENIEINSALQKQSSHKLVSRRAFLRTLAAAGGEALLVACGKDGETTGAVVPTNVASTPVKIEYYEIPQLPDPKDILLDDRIENNAAKPGLRRVVIWLDQDYANGSIAMAAEFPNNLVLTRIRAEEYRRGL